MNNENDLLIDFQKRLTELGFIVDKGLVINGEFQRLDVVGKKRGNKAGSYVAFIEDYHGKKYLNAYIRDFYRNNGEIYNSKNYNNLNMSDKYELKNKFEQKREKKELYNLRNNVKIFADFRKEFEVNSKVIASHKYLSDKNLDLDSIVTANLPHIDSSGNLLLKITSPLNNNIEGLQRISPNGFKHLDKYSSIKGNCIFLNAIQDSYPGLVFLSTGYSTSLAIQNAMQQSVYACVSDTNAIHSAKNLQTKFPDKQVIFFADNDIGSELKMRKNLHPNPINSGIETAKKLKEDLGITSIVPNLGNRHSDFSDFLSLYGKQELNKFINIKLRGIAMNTNRSNQQFYNQPTYGNNQILEEDLREASLQEEKPFEKEAPAGKDGKYTKEQLERFYGSKDRSIKNMFEQAVKNEALFQKAIRAGEIQMPRNMISGREYSNSNALALLHTDATAEGWITRKQAENSKYPILKAEKEGAVIFTVVQKEGKTYFNATSVFSVENMENRNSRDALPIAIEDGQVVSSFNRIAQAISTDRKAMPLLGYDSSQNDVAQSLNGLIKYEVEEANNKLEFSNPKLALDDADKAISENLTSLLTAIKHGLPYIPPVVNEQLAKKVQDRLEYLAVKPAMFKKISKNCAEVVNKIEKNVDVTRAKEYDKAIGVENTRQMETEKSKYQGMER